MVCKLLVVLITSPGHTDVLSLCPCAFIISQETMGRKSLACHPGRRFAELACLECADQPIVVLAPVFESGSVDTVHKCHPCLLDDQQAVLRLKCTRWVEYTPRAWHSFATGPLVGQYQCCGENHQRDH